MQENLASSKIRHTQTSLGSSEEPAVRPKDDLSEMQVVDSQPDGDKKEIRAFGEVKRHEDKWDRTPNTTGKGAIHVRSFHCKLTEDALVYMDEQVNEWLDKHPQYEVKFVNSSIGNFSGKTKDPQLVCQVWV